MVLPHADCGVLLFVHVKCCCRYDNSDSDSDAMDAIEKARKEKQVGRRCWVAKVLCECSDGVRSAL